MDLWFAGSSPKTIFNSSTATCSTYKGTKLFWREMDLSISSRLKVFKLLPVFWEITETKSFTLLYYLDSGSNKMQAQGLNQALVVLSTGHPTPNGDLPPILLTEMTTATACWEATGQNCVLSRNPNWSKSRSEDSVLLLPQVTLCFQRQPRRALLTG